MQDEHPKPQPTPSPTPPPPPAPEPPPPPTPPHEIRPLPIEKPDFFEKSIHPRDHPDLED